MKFIKEEALPIALDIIKKWEGCKLQSYQDIVGIWTIGYGATGPNIKKGLAWTQEQADEDLLSRVKIFALQIDSVLKVPLTKNQAAAMISLAYNIGANALSKSTVMKKTNLKDFKAAADAFLLWNKARVDGKLVPVQGLTNRREDERLLFLKG
jgi:lysozyme